MTKQNIIGYKITKECLYCRREKIQRIEDLKEWVRNGPYHECECESTPAMKAVIKIEKIYEEAALVDFPCHISPDSCNLTTA